MRIEVRDDLVGVMSVVAKHYNQKQLEEERVYFVYASIPLFTIKESQNRNISSPGTKGQELIQRPWRSGAYQG